MNDPEVQSFVEVLAQQPWIEEMAKTLRAGEIIQREQPHWIEPHAIAVRFGLPIDQAKLFLHLPGYKVKYKVYHNCCECPIALMAEPTLPDEWECPECQEELTDDEVSFEPVGVRIEKVGDRP